MKETILSFIQHLYKIRERKSRLCLVLAKREFNVSKRTRVSYCDNFTPLVHFLQPWPPWLRLCGYLIYKRFLKQSIFKGICLAIRLSWLMPLCQPFRSCSCPDGVWVSIFQGEFSVNRNLSYHWLRL